MIKESCDLWDERRGDWPMDDAMAQQLREQRERNATADQRADMFDAERCPPAEKQLGVSIRLMQNYQPPDPMCRHPRATIAREAVTDRTVMRVLTCPDCGEWFPLGLAKKGPEA